MKIEQVWRDILLNHESLQFVEGDYQLKLLDPEAKFSFFAGADSKKRVLIAIEINCRPPDINLETQAIDYFRSQRKNGTWLMALRLYDLDLVTVFGRLCQDLIDASGGMPSQKALINLFRDRLNLWKKLFQNSNKGLLQIHEIKGLLAELVALENLLTSTSSVTTTIMGWIGPQGADQDFIFNDFALEIKAIAPSVTKVGISSIEQLDSILPIELWVYVLRESNSDEDNNINLLSQVSIIEAMLNLEPNALNIFKAKVLESGYVENEYYKDICFKVTDLLKFAVAENFPKFKRELVPSGILDATYSISLSAISNFRI